MNNGYLYEPPDNRNNRKERSIGKRLFRIISIVLTFWLGIYIVSIFIQPQESKNMQKESVQYVIIDVCDSGTAEKINEIRLWKDYKNQLEDESQKVVHGEKVKLIKREDSFVLIKTGNGKRGWISDKYIKEVE
ncbi:MAG: SH3 domain-containing protein [Candidatus Kuenenia sp.]|nr:SH3 domain-containing protein [Candidatus Kuenenia hertensis]